MDLKTHPYFIEIEFGTPQFDQAMDLRTRILRIPLNMEFHVKDIELEWNDFHFGLILPSFKLVACVTMQPVRDHVLKMRQVAVDEHYQGQGYGKYLVRQTENWCKDRHFKEIELNARETAVSFYQGMDYEIIGDMFEEVGIPHYKFKKKIG